MPDNLKNDAADVLEKFVLELVKEQKSKRRWGIFFKFIFLGLLLILMWGFVPWNSISFPHKNLNSRASHPSQVAKINIYGEIAATSEANASDTIDALDEAVKDKNIQAVILDINSPGGSPVQASYIYNELRRLEKLYPQIKFDAVCEDVCASAAYYIASSAQNIYANPTSLVGSIGVLLDSFGFVDTLKKIGADRRLYTAGKYKGLLDPFSPVNPDALGFIQQLLNDDHAIFINDVKTARGSRLSNDPNLFTGLIWNGIGAKKLGLTDGFGSVADIARIKYHSDDIVDFTIKKSFFEQLSSQFSASFWHHVRTEFFTAKLS